MSSFSCLCSGMKQLGVFLINDKIDESIRIIDSILGEISKSKADYDEDQMTYITNNLSEIQVLIFMGLGNYELYNIYLDVRFYIQYSKINWGARLIRHRLTSTGDLGSLDSLPAHCLYIISQNL